MSKHIAIAVMITASSVFAQINCSGAQNPLPVSANVPRGELRLTDFNPDPTTHQWRSWQVAAPEERLAADPTIPGSVPTAELVHVVYMDRDAQGGSHRMEYRRSTDGGQSFSTPQVLDTLQSVNETYTTWTRGQLVARGHEVYWVFAKSSNGSDFELFLMGSEDQGQTWDGPLRIGDPSLNLIHNADPKIAASSGVLHIAWRANNVGGAQPTDGVYYAQAAYVNGTLGFSVPGTKVDNGLPGAYTVYFVDVAAEGTLVQVLWQDDRAVPGSRINTQTFSKVDVALGFSIANSPEINHTPGSPATAWDAREPHAAIAGNNVYVVMEDSRGSRDEIHLSYSNDAGITWSQVSGVNRSPGYDIDRVRVLAEGNDLWLFYADDRNQGANGGNWVNNVFMVHDSQAGAGFAAGMQTEVVVSTYPHGGALYDVDMVDDTIVCAYEMGRFTNPNGTGPNGEDCGYSVSTDRGATWQEFKVTNLGSLATQPSCGADVDDNYVTMTANKDVVMVWMDDREWHDQGNQTNHIWLISRRVPELLDGTATGGGMQIVNLGPGAQGDFAVVLASISGAGTPHAFDPLGHTVYLNTNDFVFQSLLSNIPIVAQATVDATGRASFPALPNLRGIAAMAGWTFTFAGVTWNGSIVDITDPVVLR